MKTRWSSLLPLLLLACGGPAEEAAEPKVASEPPAVTAPTAGGPERVETERVATARLRATIAASGTVAAKRITEVGSEVPGRIVAVLVDVGDEVEAGAPLFRIDPGPYQMALTEAEAGLALARAESANAAAEAERLRTLLAQNAASQARYDQLRTHAEVARAQVAQMAARVAKARRDLAQTEVVAPYTASVVERRAHEGAMAGQAAILVLQESGALEAILNVPETTPVAVRTGDALRLFVEGLPDPIEAAVTSVSQRVDPGTRTYEVRADLRDASGQLKAGSYARAELSVSRAEPRPVAHRSAVLTRDGRTFVLKVEDGVVRYTPVRVGVSQGEQVELLSGVAEGDLIVRGEATTRLADGARVEIAPDGAQARSEQPEPRS
jgi:RND family efflux transporter MFP subunit